MLLQNLQDEFAELMNADDIESTIITPAANIKIYHNNMMNTLIQTLQDIYKMCVQLVGEDFFRASAREYIDRYPSLSIGGCMIMDNISVISAGIFTRQNCLILLKSRNLNGLVIYLLLP